MELAPGVTTPGWFDTRSVAAQLPWPDLHGKRCLDIATFDGFWAFEMERRGASEVVAIDILDEARWDWPVTASPVAIEAVQRRKSNGDGFLISKRAIASGVERLDLSVYDLDPATHGTFDFVYLGSLLLHLRDPVRALERVHAVTRGALMSVDAIDTWLSIVHPRRPVAWLDGLERPYWWKPNLAGFGRMLRAGGFRLRERPRPFLMSAGEGFDHPPSRPWVLRTHNGREALLASRLGDPHAVAIAQP